MPNSKGGDDGSPIRKSKVVPHHLKDQMERRWSEVEKESERKAEMNGMILDRNLFRDDDQVLRKKKSVLRQRANYAPTCLETPRKRRTRTLRHSETEGATQIYQNQYLRLQMT